MPYGPKTRDVVVRDGLEAGDVREVRDAQFTHPQSFIQMKHKKQSAHKLLLQSLWLVHF